MTDAGATPISPELAAKKSTVPAPLALLLLLAILVGGFYLTYLRATYDGLIFDEHFHLVMSIGRGAIHLNLPSDKVLPDTFSLTALKGAPPWYQVWTHLNGVTHPPLCFIVLRLWREAFGESDLTARMMPITCLLIGTVLLFNAVRIWIGIVPALWTAALFALSPAQTQICQEVRGYALAEMLLCGLLLTIALIEIRGVTRWRWLALCLLTLALPLTHYFGLFADAAIGAYVLFRFRGVTRRNAVIAMAIAGVVYVTTWGPFMWQQKRDISDAADTFLVEKDSSMSEHAIKTLVRAGAIPVRRIAEPIEWTADWPNWLGAALILSSIIVIKIDKRKDLIVWLFILAGTLGCVTALDLSRSTRHLLFTRYTSLATPAICVLWSATIIASSDRKWWLNHILPLVVLIYALSLRSTAYTRFGEPEWSDLRDVISEKVQPEETLIFYSGTQPWWYSRVQYLATSHYNPPTVPRSIVLLSKPANESLVKEIPTRTAWMISGPLALPADQILPGSKVLEQITIPNIAICTHVELPAKK